MSDSLARTLRAEGSSENTVYSYTLSVRLLADFLRDRGHDLTVDVSRNDIRDFIAKQGRPHKFVDSKGQKHRSGSPATALVRFKSLQQFFRHCVEEGELDESPMAGMRAPNVEPPPVPVVDDDVLKKLLGVRAGTSFVDRRDTALIRFFVDTPCRLSEVTNLRQGDLDLKRQRAMVLGKGAKIRSVPLGMKASTAIDRYLRCLERERPEAVGEDKPLWLGRQGRLSTSGVSNILHRICADAGVPQLHWHQFRHTFAHAWMAEGGNEGDLMEIGGWEDRSMLDRYGRSARVDRAHAAAKRMSLGDRV